MDNETATMTSTQRTETIIRYLRNLADRVERGEVVADELDVQNHMVTVTRPDATWNESEPTGHQTWTLRIRKP